MSNESQMNLRCLGHTCTVSILLKRDEAAAETELRPTFLGPVKKTMCSHSVTQCEAKDKYS